ncbi:MAG: ATP-binding protein [Bacteroidales bacterium]|nr:ATP-binding protein [Bacteroidales bacterium]MDD4822740.1 ATP-binding protein [Bacteroidales bacterium]
MKIAVASGKGGTGKTFVSTNLFCTFRHRGLFTSLTDCDAETPNSLIFFRAKRVNQTVVSEYRPVIDASKCLFCGQCYEYCTYNAIFYLPALQKIKLLNDLCHGCGACSVACQYDAITDSQTSVGEVSSYEFADEEDGCLIEAKMNVGVYSPVPVIKSAIKIALQQNAEVMIFDAPPGTSCSFIQTVYPVDYVILVTEPTPFGLSDLKQAVETLRELNKEFGVVINRAGIGNKDVYHYLNEESITLIGEIPFDKSIASCYSKGEIVIDQLSSVRTIFENIADKLIQYGNRDN